MANTFPVTVIFAAVILMCTPTHATQAAEPVRLIFDTDICGDCDDVLALGMIHSLQSRGLCRLLAVTISVDHELAAPFVDAVNTFYERGDIPIGGVGKGGVVEKSEFLSLVDGTSEWPLSLSPRRGVKPSRRRRQRSSSVRLWRPSLIIRS